MISLEVQKTLHRFHILSSSTQVLAHPAKLPKLVQKHDKVVFNLSSATLANSPQEERSMMWQWRSEENTTPKICGVSHQANFGENFSPKAFPRNFI